MKGTGIANTCPTLDAGSSNIKDLKAGSYKLGKFCMEPTSFTVKEESQVCARMPQTDAESMVCRREAGDGGSRRAPRRTAAAQPTDRPPFNRPCLSAHLAACSSRAATLSSSPPS